MSTDSATESTPAELDQRAARGYSWPPFERGNTAALKHGAASPTLIQPLADAFVAQLQAVATWATLPPFAGTVESWAWAEGQAHLLRRYLEEHGHLDAEGEERPASRMLDRIEGRLSKLRDQLGLNPAALGKIVKDAAVVATATGDVQTLAALNAEGLRIIEAVRGQAATDQEGTDA